MREERGEGGRGWKGVRLETNWVGERVVGGCAVGGGKGGEGGDGDRVVDCGGGDTPLRHQK